MSNILEIPNRPRWDAIACVVEHNTRDLLDKRFSLHSEVASWFKSLKLFRETETERLVLQAHAADDLNWHRALVAALIADGERLLLQWKTHPAENPDRIKPSDLQAAVEGLYATQSMWHGDLTAAQRKEILRAVFNVNPDEISFAPPADTVAAH